MKPKRVWLARDTCSDDYALFATKPTLSDSRHLGWPPLLIMVFCSAEFEKITGYKLAPGEIRRVRIRIEEV